MLEVLSGTDRCYEKHKKKKKMNIISVASFSIFLKLVVKLSSIKDKQHSDSFLYQMLKASVKHTSGNKENVQNLTVKQKQNCLRLFNY